jgi:2,3,4,5-tetrahydropyridine-2-carboxylate N-succinyltransferase
MEIKRITEEAWENRAELATADIADLNNVITSVFEDLDSGRQRIAEKINGQWQVNTWLKKAVLLSFRLWDNKIGDLSYDKVPLKFANWDSERFKNSGIRAVHGNVVRYGAYIAPKVVLMPSFVNLGAYVDEGTLVDTWATVGSCAQVGKNCHISGGAGIGGVLEPLQANPVIIEDNCFIGARSEVVEGMIIEEGAVIGMGVFLGASTPIMDRSTGDITYGRIPPYSVVISGTLPGKPLQDGRPGPNLPCAVIVKQVDERTRSKTSINELLRPL